MADRKREYAVARCDGFPGHQRGCGAEFVYVVRRLYGGGIGNPPFYCRPCELHRSACVHDVMAGNARAKIPKAKRARDAFVARIKAKAGAT